MVNKLLENWAKLDNKLQGCSHPSTFECAMLCRYLIKLIDNFNINKSEFSFFYRDLISMLDLPRSKCPKYKKNYKYKLNQHFKRLIQPFYQTKGWLSEIFSVLYYSLAVVITGWRKK